MSKSSIEWTDDTWNPVSGCTRVSAGCDNCYAVKMTKRLEAMGKPKYAGLVNIGKAHFNGTVRCHEDALTIPLKAKKPRRWFVNSMSDLFHKEVPFEFIDRVFAVMALCPQHTFQVLTKRPERMAEYLETLSPSEFDEKMLPVIDWASAHAIWTTTYICRDQGPSRPVHGWPLPNVWLGTSAEDQQTADERVPHLLKCPAAVRFLSCEPLLGPVRFYSGDVIVCKACGSFLSDDEEELFKPCPCGCTHYVWDTPTDKATLEDIEDPSELGIHWVIVGGESGPGARPMHPDWARSLRDQCVAAGVPFFFKQWGEWVEEMQLAEDAVIPAVKCYEPWSEYDEAEQCFFGDRTAVWKLGKKSAGRLLDGRTWDEFPEAGE